MSDRTSPISRRAYARWPVSLAARLEAGDASTECQVSDLSVGGARIAPAVDAPRDSQVVLDLLAYGRFTALIAWTSASHSGLRFTGSAARIAEALQAIALYSNHDVPDGETAAAPPIQSRPAEAARYEASESNQLQIALAENRDLKTTIAELRDGLEALTYSRREAVQQAHAESQEEIRQLEAAVAAVRERLEQVRDATDAAVEQVRVESRDEIAQLKGTVATLRDELEDQRIRHEDIVQNQQREFAHERAQLTETIAVLRQSLERCGKQGNH